MSRLSWDAFTSQKDQTTFLLNKQLRKTADSNTQTRIFSADKKKVLIFGEQPVNSAGITKDFGVHLYAVKGDSLESLD